MKQARLFVIAGIVLCCFSTPCFAADVTGRAYVDASFGTLFFISDDYMNGSAFDASIKPRLFGNLGFGYVFKPYLAASMAIGFGWQAYSHDDMLVSTVAPVTIGAEYRLGTGKYVPKAGVGLGLYQWSVLYDREISRDPITREERRRTDFGGYMMGGVDYFARPNVVVSLEGVGHRIFSEDTDAFVVGYGFKEDVLMITMSLKYFFATQKGSL
jgi:hypothetical protein